MCMSVVSRPFRYFKPCYIWKKVIKNSNIFPELDALGDDLAFDEDTSYLDEAEKAPTVPDTDLPWT